MSSDVTDDTAGTDQRGDRGRAIRPADEKVSVRAPRDDAEVAAVFATEAAVFLDRDRGKAEQWLDAVTSESSFAYENIRAAYIGDDCVGMALIHRRDIGLGGAQVPAAFISGVGVLDELRGHGVGSAVMQDVSAFCVERRIPLSLLIGAHLFYDPFGYVDMFDPDQQWVTRKAAADITSPSGWSVRTATVDDAAAMLALYEDEYRGYLTHPVRTLDEQRLFLRLILEEFDVPNETSTRAAPRVAIAPDGRVAGYIAVPQGVHPWAGWEAVTPEWPAAAALLREHAALPLPVDGDPSRRPADADAIRWVYPSDSRTAQTVGDHVAVRTEFDRTPSGGWMAVSPDPQQLLDALDPLWMRRAAARGIRVEVGGAVLELPGDPSTTVRLTSATLVPLLFGHRNAAWAARQPGSEITDDGVELLTALVASPRTWVAPSDYR